MSEGKDDGMMNMMDKALDGMMDKGPDTKLQILRFRALNVGDAKEDVRIPEHLWTPVLLALRGKMYAVEEAFHEAQQYFRCVKPYKTRDFQKLWGFSCECADYVDHKIIVVQDHSSW